MRSFARFLIILALVVWVGGIIFFSAVVAPALFSILPKPELAAGVVGVSLTALHLIGLVCGVVLFVLTFLIRPGKVRAVRTLVGFMILLTAISQFVVIPQMQRIRDLVGGSIEALPPKDAGRAAFDRLHQFSVGLEGATLVAGLVVIGLISQDLKEDARP
ncbi:MAG TPA: DUF4149 domain-containing protein [Terriglobales bacterium]|nr:DUF4149 domain-containing protein [Terriglobales bacterium]